MKHLFLSLCLALAANSASAAASDLEKNMLTRITAAEKHLASNEKNIATERAALARELGKLERSVNKLQEQTAAARRQADEKNLSLTQLQQRLQQWTSQHQYQSNLVQQFMRQQSISSNSPSLSAQLEQILAMAADSEQWLEPQWNAIELVQGNGVITPAQRLSLGPVHWAVTTDSAFRSELRDGEWVTLHSVSSNDQQTLNSLRQGSTEQLPLSFDPSLSMLSQVPDESVSEHLQKGGIWVVPILLFALLALTIAVIKALQLWRLPEIQAISPSRLTQAINDKQDVDGIAGMQAALLTVAREIPQQQERDDQLFLQLQHNRIQLERRLTAIAITASVSPLLGLLGTVSGMIETFRMMTLFGSGNPEVVSGGIAQALITTELGLVVAIPALVIHSLLSRRARAYYQQLENFALLLSKADNNSNDEKQINPRQEALSA
ncbi:MotA/TolQ/ExbB proton channel family protein [Thalassolituus marinus]|nr:MotA/TolQ/ExbB proton channel family protein [Thalassolituus marinus]